MDELGLFVQFVRVFAACSPSENAVEIAQTQVSTLGPFHILILLLVTLILIASFVLAAILVIQRLIRIHQAYRKIVSGQLRAGSDRSMRYSREPDLNQQILDEQQWLFTQMISQDHEVADTQDLVDLTHDGWI